MSGARGRRECVRRVVVLGSGLSSGSEQALRLDRV